MKTNRFPIRSKSVLLCTDGSTLNVPFIYPREDIAFNPDLKSNLIWLPESTQVEIEGLNSRSSKLDHYSFNFNEVLK
jgi:hypothetical protein